MAPTMIDGPRVAPASGAAARSLVGVGVCAEAAVMSNAVPAKAAVSVFANMCSSFIET